MSHDFQLAAGAFPNGGVSDTSARAIPAPVFWPDNATLALHPPILTSQGACMESISLISERKSTASARCLCIRSDTRRDMPDELTTQAPTIAATTAQVNTSARAQPSLERRVPLLDMSLHPLPRFQKHTVKTVREYRDNFIAQIICYTLGNAAYFLRATIFSQHETGRRRTR
jgi:hypothetical protein